MKFYMQKDLFIKQLEKAAAVVNEKASIPVLTGVLVDCRTPGVMFSGSDGTERVDLLTRFGGERGECQQEGRAIIPAPSIIKVVKKFKADVVTLELFENGELLISESTKKSFTFMTMPAEEYPNAAAGEGESWATLMVAELEQLSKQTLHAVSLSETRPILTGLHLKSTEDGLQIIATDSHRLAKTKLIKSEISSGDVVLPAASLRNALKVLSSEQKIEIRLMDGVQVLMKGGSTMYRSRLLQGTYPDTSRLIPQQSDFKTTVSISKRELYDTLEQVSYISQIATFETVGETGLSISPQGNQIAKAQVEVPCDVTGDGIRLGANVRYMLDSLKALDSETLQLNFIGAARPFVITGKDGSGAAHVELILPIRTV